MALAIAKEENQNKTIAISVRHGHPLNTTVYDVNNDHYYVKGVSSFDIGLVAHNYVCYMDGVFRWRVNLPMPPGLINKYMTPEQKESLKNWSRQFPKVSYDITYLQMVKNNAY